MHSAKIVLLGRHILKPTTRQSLPSLWQSINNNSKPTLRNVSVATKQMTVGMICRSPTYLANKYCTPATRDDDLDIATFEKLCDETLDSLTEYFEELVEAATHLQAADVSYGNGVLNVSFGNPHGTYVINRQTPNRQIWLSSPISGPKRYDYSADEKCWIYKHDGRSLHELLQSEVPTIVRMDVDFSRCAHSRLIK